MGCGASSSSNEPTLSLDFGDSPAGSDTDPAKEVRDNLKQADQIIAQLRNFKGCGDLVREAITNASPENEEKAWAAVVPSVDILKQFYEFSLALEKSVKVLFGALCSESAMGGDLSDQEALTKQLALVFDFVLRFDDLKMTNPAIQNDFSYYRRILNRIKLSNKKAAGITVGAELANAMSLFFAYPTPMMNSLIKTTTALTSDGSVKLDILSAFLARLANSCYILVSDNKKSDVNEEVTMLYFRTIAGSIILYDHVNPKGAFTKKTPIQIKGAVTALKNYQGREKTDSLVNALRFNTVHLNDDDTPASFKSLLA